MDPVYGRYLDNWEYWYPTAGDTIRCCRGVGVREFEVYIVERLRLLQEAHFTKPSADNICRLDPGVSITSIPNLDLQHN